jgi:hypothetical protein
MRQTGNVGVQAEKGNRHKEKNGRRRGGCKHPDIDAIFDDFHQTGNLERCLINIVVFRWKIARTKAGIQRDATSGKLSPKVDVLSCKLRISPPIQRMRMQGAQYESVENEMANSAHHTRFQLHFACRYATLNLRQAKS